MWPGGYYRALMSSSTISGEWRATCIAGLNLSISENYNQFYDAKLDENYFILTYWQNMSNLSNQHYFIDINDKITQHDNLS